MTPCIFHFTGSLTILKEAVEKLLADKSFYLPSPLAAAAVATAKLLKQWQSTENMQPTTAYSDILVASLKCCFPCHSNMCVRREKMWGNFHQLRSSDSFQSMCGTFLRKCAAKKASPTFSQYITDVIFRDMIKHEFPLIHFFHTLKKMHRNILLVMLRGTFTSNFNVQCIPRNQNSNSAF